MSKIASIFALCALRLLTPARCFAESEPQTIDGLYSHALGNPDDQAIVFIHGGPGFSSYDFEATTAEPLARLGFYVVTYDERGQGRSAPAPRSAFTYRAYAKDLATLIEKRRRRRPILIGHSHGGPIAIAFDQLYPEVAKLIVLVSAPVDFWQTMRNAEANCALRYEAQPGSGALLASLKSDFAKISSERNGSEASAQTLANVFKHELFGCKLYSTAKPSSEESRLRSLIVDPPPAEEDSTTGFLANELYIYRDWAGQVSARSGRYVGVYGDEDGLFSNESRARIKRLVGRSAGGPRFFFVRGASHAVYIDQQETFLRILSEVAAVARR